ncbi:MAG: HAMP domain-containing histidine kinase [Hyphomonadaceae bacterium]|nr:HAMP domain-containing histidine kinase [Hyphomonadaceae bacterium]
MSTQQAVTAASRWSLGVRLAAVCWLWLAGATACGLLAWALGADSRLMAEATALAVAPAWAGFVALPWLKHRWAARGWLAVWVLTITGLAAGTGGASSPLAAGFLVPPAIAMLVLSRSTLGAGVAALAAFGLAIWLSRFAPDADLGVYAAAMAALCIAFVAALMTLARVGQLAAPVGAIGPLAEVSHELRTPLTHILGFSEMIERQVFGEVGARYVEYAGLIRRSGNHLLGLVNDLLDLSRIEAGGYEVAKERFDARLIVEEVVRLSADSAAKKQIALGLITPDAPLAVRADAQNLRRMLINIVGNAIKFTPEGGRVMISARAERGVLVVDVADSGPGISREERARLGRAFARSKAAAQVEGTGLGLALVRALASLHGGDLSFHDSPEGGVLVRIALPVLSAEA